MSMRYGSYKKPYPLAKIPVLRGRRYEYADSTDDLVMPYFPEVTDVSRRLARLNVNTANRARTKYVATGQWFERSVGGGSARMSPAYTQFADPLDGADRVPPPRPRPRHDFVPVVRKPTAPPMRPVTPKAPEAAASTTFFTKERVEGLALGASLMVGVATVVSLVRRRRPT